jgi:hypothetical protein
MKGLCVSRQADRKERKVAVGTKHRVSFRKIVGTENRECLRKIVVAKTQFLTKIVGAKNTEFLRKICGWVPKTESFLGRNFVHGYQKQRVS